MGSSVATALLRHGDVEENCPDLRNSRVGDVKSKLDANALQALGLRIWPP